MASKKRNKSHSHSRRQGHPAKRYQEKMAPAPAHAIKPKVAVKSWRQWIMQEFPLWTVPAISLCLALVILGVDHQTVAIIAASLWSLGCLLPLLFGQGQKPVLLIMISSALLLAIFFMDLGHDPTPQKEPATSPPANLFGGPGG